jgi:hypothetical protein
MPVTKIRHPRNVIIYYIRVIKIFIKTCRKFPLFGCQTQLFIAYFPEQTVINSGYFIGVRLSRIIQIQPHYQRSPPPAYILSCGSNYILYTNEAAFLNVCIVFSTVSTRCLLIHFRIFSGTCGCIIDPAEPVTRFPYRFQIWLRLNPETHTASILEMLFNKKRIRYNRCVL